MTGKKLGKVLLVWLCIITLLMPFGSEVLAATMLSNSDTEAVLESIPYREGGDESTDITSDDYDRNMYAYNISGVDVLKVLQKNDAEFLDTFYCLNAEKSLSVQHDYNYTKVSDDLTNFYDSDVQDWVKSIGISQSNFEALIYLLNNLYAKNLDTTYKNQYIEKAFAEKIKEDEESIPQTTVEMIKTHLTDDDIEVIQQWAIWYFTNGTNESKNTYHNELYKSLGNISVKKLVPQEGGKVSEVSEDLSTIDSTRYEYAQILFDYLIDSAKSAPSIAEDEDGEVVYPSLDKNRDIKMDIEEDYYKVGPFRINSGTVTPDDLEIIFSTEGGSLDEVNYQVYQDETKVADKSLDFSFEFDKDYYIYIPIENNTITQISLKISYTTNKSSKRNLSLWVGKNDTENKLQPLVLLTQEPGTKVEEKVDSENPVEPPKEKIYDLALRKFIVSVNGTATTGRTPEPTEKSLEDLANGSVTTAEYRHKKSPVTVEKGDKIVYEFRIYNEGEVDAIVKEIVDYLPEGLKVVDKSESSINSNFNWNVNDDRTITNTYLSNTTINKFDKDTKKLSYGKIQLECEIVGDLSEGTELTNVAEIKLDDGDEDRDSIENSIEDTIKKEDSTNSWTNGWTGSTSNKKDLSDSNYHYKGAGDKFTDGDDNDYEKVVIAGKQFDLSLQKFISSVNGKAEKRAPEVDVTPLKNGGDDAKYTASKNPVSVETGDIVTFTLRVYNEGEIDGYAEEITDYIPEGLGFLVNYNKNYENSWKISPDSKSVKLSDIKDGTKNVKLSDFTDVETLNEVDVVLGRSKITSTALKSSDTSTTNLIKAFDGTELSYKDVEVSFIVVTEDELTLKNIAAITKESNKDREPVETDRGPDRDSTPKDDIDPDKYTTGNEDDDDYDIVKTDKKDFDLALQKFITRLNDEEVKDREPVVSSSNGKIKYTHPQANPLYVGNGDLVEYTIRVYNEGEIDGYASEIKDDIPTGLVFVPENETNKQYGWKMYDNSGNETTDSKQAVSVKTTYLSKENSESNIIGKFDGSTLLYKEVKLVFKVDESVIDKTVSSEKRTLINTAEITKNTDKDGNDIPDIDSTPDNNKPGEDDIDNEKVYVKYFDLALEKSLSKAVVTTNGETKEVVGDSLKIEIHKKNINSTSIQFVYRIKVTNQGEIEGYATEVTDYIPEGLSFNKASNPSWTQVSDRVIKTEALAKTLLKPGESVEVEVVLDWVQSSENIGRFVNVAEISEDWNPYDSHDIDSTPNNNVSTEDDQDDAPVWVGIVTGLGDQPYIILTTTVLIILATGVILIKKYVL